MSIFSVIGDGLTKMVKDTVKLRSLRKEDVQKLLRTNIEGHAKMAYILSVQSDASMKNWMTNKVRPALRTNQSKAKTVLDDYTKQLRGKAAADERQRPLKSLMEVNDSMSKLLEEISKKIDKLMEPDSVDIYNVRMSQMAILGLLRQSNRVLNFSAYLYSYLVKVPAYATASIPRYREIYLIDKVDSVADIVNQVREKKGAYLFLQEVDSLRKKNADMVLGATGRFDFGAYAVSSNYTPSFLDNIMSALSCLNFFTALLDAWDDYKLAKHERNLEIQEWLTQHATLLRMDMEDMDKTSPEYQNMLSIIKAYDEQIADYDKKILQFENEDKG